MASPNVAGAPSGAIPFVSGILEVRVLEAKNLNSMAQGQAYVVVECDKVGNEWWWWLYWCSWSVESIVDIIDHFYLFDWWLVFFGFLLCRVGLGFSPNNNNNNYYYTNLQKSFKKNKTLLSLLRTNMLITLLVVGAISISIFIDELHIWISLFSLPSCRGYFKLQVQR